MGEDRKAGVVPGVTVEFDVPARMRDGVTLRANVYRPQGEGPWPTLLMRTPYGTDEPEMLDWLDPVIAARAGFMVVLQDTRGRFSSEGEWEPLRYEREDGYDSVEWAARLRGSNGRVGMFGLSYFGSTQWMAAVEQPPSLGAIAPGCTWADPLDGVFARGGALELGVALPWDLLTGAGHLAKLAISDDERARRVATILDDVDDLSRLTSNGYREIPVSANSVLRRHGMPDIGTIAMLSNPAVPEWCRVNGKHERVTVPTLNIAAWHDVFIQGSLDNYVAMAELGRPARLIVGPWTHLRFTDPFGELCYGIRASRVGVPVHAEGDLNDVQLSWFRRHLASGTPATGADPEAPVRIFVMGGNEWRDETSWPLTRARDERWFLHGDGTLSSDAPEADSQPTEFTYDPADPVPTHGGPIIMAAAFPAGPLDQARVEARPDVLVYTSEPLQRDLEVTGRIRAVLHVESSAPSTDWVARLCDVHPDGRSYNLCDGILRISEKADALQQIEIDLWSTSNVFLAGHRLRVHITSSSFPRWDRNLNTGNQDAPHFVRACQRLYHTTTHASWIELPIVD